jgi:hypothetical protein
VRSRAFLVPASLLALTLVAGCTDTESGNATADPGSTPVATEETSEPPPTSTDGGEPTVDIPPPPREISLDGLDPCMLYTDEQRAQLTVDDVRGEESTSNHYKGMKECILDVTTREPFYGYNVLAVTSEGIGPWLSGSRNVEAELTSIGGFPAARYNTLGVDSNCEFAIGVSTTQHLQVEMAPLTSGFEYDQICQMSEQAAQMAIATLQTLR